MDTKQIIQKTANWHAHRRDAFLRDKLIEHLGYLPSPEEIAENAYRFVMHDGIECYTWKAEVFATIDPRPIPVPEMRFSSPYIFDKIS